MTKKDYLEKACGGLEVTETKENWSVGLGSCAHGTTFTHYHVNIKDKEFKIDESNEKFSIQCNNISHKKFIEIIRILNE